MNVIDRDLEVIKSIADALTPHGIHVIECKGHDTFTLNATREINGVEIKAGEYAKLELSLYFPLTRSTQQD
ncbi:MAG TPA: hypothetical protein VLB46_07700 [Pyrinomonadaceae bacterium]|nr:hypothetical protein [Pyrinomonadaceae bacterium]